MTIRELITILQTHDPELPVIIRGGDDLAYDPRVGRGEVTMYAGEPYVGWPGPGEAVLVLSYGEMYGDEGDVG